MRWYTQNQKVGGSNSAPAIVGLDCTALTIRVRAADFLSTQHLAIAVITPKILGGS